MRGRIDGRRGFERLCLDHGIEKMEGEIKHLEPLYYDNGLVVCHRRFI